MGWGRKSRQQQNQGRQQNNKLALAPANNQTKTVNVFDLILQYVNTYSYEIMSVPNPYEHLSQIQNFAPTQLVWQDPTTGTYCFIYNGKRGIVLISESTARNLQQYMSKKTKFSR